METYLVMVDVEVDGVLNQNIFAFKVPMSQPVPLPDDFIQIPESTATQENLPIVLKVVSRRFVFDNLILNQLSRDCKACIILLAQPPT